MMIRLLSAISLAVVAVLGADLSAEAPAHEKKHHAKEEAKPAAPVAITEKNISEVETSLKVATVVDARGKGEETIPGAIFLAADASDKDIHAKLKDKNAMIITYCGSVSCPASMTLAERLVGLGYTNVCHYAGGIKEWTENSKPTDKPKA
jgi:rhodanese-related sulfurtransferase